MLYVCVLVEGGRGGKGWTDGCFPEFSETS